jgi:transposase
LWEIARPLIPPDRARPQGRGTQNTPDESVFAAIVYVLVSGCAWRSLPPLRRLSPSTVVGGEQGAGLPPPQLQTR